MSAYWALRPEFGHSGQKLGQFGLHVVLKLALPASSWAKRGHFGLNSGRGTNLGISAYIRAFRPKSRPLRPEVGHVGLKVGISA